MALMSAGLIGERINFMFNVFAAGGGRGGYLKADSTDAGFPVCENMMARFAQQEHVVENDRER
jgi:hypothetical protein